MTIFGTRWSTILLGFALGALIFLALFAVNEALIGVVPTPRV